MDFVADCDAVIYCFCNQMLFVVAQRRQFSSGDCMRLSCGMSRFFRLCHLHSKSIEICMSLSSVHLMSQQIDCSIDQINMFEVSGVFFYLRCMCTWAATRQCSLKCVIVSKRHSDWNFNGIFTFYDRFDDGVCCACITKLLRYEVTVNGLLSVGISTNHVLSLTSMPDNGTDKFVAVEMHACRIRN